MKIYTNRNVLNAARERMRRVFTEFPVVVVGFSGGKDSTVTLELALEAARELGRLPVKVMFLDQEAEWMGVIEHVREVMARPEVTPMWLQIPFQIFNATSTEDPWLWCWKEGANWMRDKEPNSIKVNHFGTTRFHPMFERVAARMWPNSPMAYVAGVRCEESPMRKMALTCSRTYKEITWAKTLNIKRMHFTFYPIYDWVTSDVWKYIHEHGHRYTRVYDKMWQHGYAVRDMRVSTLCAETGFTNLKHVQEIEPETYEAITERLQGIRTCASLDREDWSCPEELPSMFETWTEYRDFLLGKLVTDPKASEAFKRQFAAFDEEFASFPEQSIPARVAINAILCNDHFGLKLKNWYFSPEINTWRKWRKGKKNDNTETNRFCIASKQ